MIRIVCTDCGGSYSTVQDAKRHADRLAFAVNFALIEDCCPGRSRGRCKVGCVNA